MKIIKHLTLSSFLLSCLLFSHGAIAEISVIVNPDNPNNVSASQIKRIFLGKLKKFPNGSKVAPINQSSDLELRKEFDKKALGKSSSQMKSYWAKVVFSGKGGPPQEVKTDDQVIEFVLGNTNGIGYIDASKVTDNVKVIATF